MPGTKKEELGSKGGPPNLRSSKSCEGCNKIMFLMSDHVGYCQQFETNVRLKQVCDWGEKNGFER